MFFKDNLLKRSDSNCLDLQNLCQVVGQELMALGHVDGKVSVSQYLLSIVRRSCTELYEMF